VRLGFAVKVLGQPTLKSNDSRRWQNGPHLSVSLAYVRDILVYLRKVRIRMYRLSSDLAPYITHPDLPQFHNQVDQCLAELEEIGALARESDVRLSFHPGAHIVLNSLDDTIATRSIADLEKQAMMLDAMGLDHRAVVVLHVGGVYDDRQAAMDRFVTRWHQIPSRTRDRLVLENDARNFSVADIEHIHQRTGIRLVFDSLHHLNNNPSGLNTREALRRCLDTWPRGLRPKIHFSSPRTEMRVAEKRDTSTGKTERVLKPPIWDQHADFVNPWEFMAFMEQARDLQDFDVMLEIKAKDLALLRLREALRRFAPEWVSKFEE
jgi:UV DNA damage endonuclease